VQDIRLGCRLSEFVDLTDIFHYYVELQRIRSSVPIVAKVDLGIKL
jgi:hypothetical protein